MKTRIKNYLLISILTILFIACKGSDDAPTEPILFDPDVSSSTTEANVAITFTDYSTGVVSRVWTFPGGSPATSTEEEVNVSFGGEGPVTCSIEVEFNDGSTESKNFVIQVGSELYSRAIFGFEDNTSAMEAWKSWVSDDSEAVTFSIDNSQGANGSSSSAKITIATPNIEAQLFTKENEKPFNAILESNKNYTLSFWIKSETITSLNSIAVNNLSEVQEWANFAWLSPVADITNSWKKISVPFETGDLSEIYPNEAQANNAFVQFKFLETTTGIIYIDEISIKENN